MTDVPAAAGTAAMSAPMAWGVAHEPVHCKPTNPAPMSPPARPPMRTATKARTLAARDGKADNGSSDITASSRMRQSGCKLSTDTLSIMTTLDDELLDLAVRLATEAGELVSTGRRRGLSSVSTKSSRTDMVTEFDRLSEHHIVNGILSVRPNDAIVGEEGASRLGTSAVSWLIDPIDGTTNFLYDLPFFSVSIAAADLHGPLVAVVFAPRLGELFTAVRGRGAFCNGQPISPSSTGELDTSLVATGFSYEPKRRAGQGHTVANLLASVRDIRRFGSAALDLCYVGCGRLDVYFETGLGPWDIAAGGLIAQEAGAVVTDFSGHAVRPEEVLAATPLVHGSFGLLLAQALQTATGAQAPSPIGQTGGDGNANSDC